MATDATDGFRVEALLSFREQMRVLVSRAVKRGYFDRFRETLVSVQLRLQTNPVSWGEPLFRMRHIGATTYHQIHDSIHFIYIVKESHRIVWLKDLQPLSHHPLATD